MKTRPLALLGGIVLIASGCGPTETPSVVEVPQPREIIDLGALVTEDLPERVWGSAFMNQMGFTENNSFEVVDWAVEFPDGTVSGSNSYYTFFNHGGPHVDAPNHMNLGEGIDGYALDSFVGPLKVIDVSGLPLGRSVPLSEIRSHDIVAGDIVLIFTGYAPPAEGDTPHRIALTQEAAEYLASLPVRAFGTDAFNVDSDDNPTPVESDLAVQRVAPNHYAFLSRGIPIFEQLFNVDRLLNEERMYFVGPPLNVENGDGMIVRPVALVY